MKKFGIIGLGWLASRYARRSIDSIPDIWATVRDEKKVSDSLKNEIEILEFDLECDDASSLKSQLKDTDYLLFTIPPSKIEKYSILCRDFFREAMRINPGLKLIFISSTSVYGSKARKVDEDSAVEPTTSNAIKLTKVEQELLDQPAAILRCGGLIGSDRHPVHFLTGRNNLSRPWAVVNLIHSDDICRFLDQLIHIDWYTGKFNLCCPKHPSRFDYYTFVARKLNLKAPHFDESDERKGKIVIPKRLKDVNFHFEYSSPFEMPLKS